MTTKEQLHRHIIDQLSQDLQTFFNAAKKAHAAATDDENIPDNKYDTLSLEASYIAQGQANRAQEIRSHLEFYESLVLRQFNEDTPIDLTALVTLETEDGEEKRVFICTRAGGMKVDTEEGEVTIITPESPLGQGLLGKTLGDSVTVGVGSKQKEFEIMEIE